MSAYISHFRLVRAFVKAGCTVVGEARGRGNPRWTATNPKTGESVHWFTQARFVPSNGEIEAHYDEKNPVVPHVCFPHPDTDISRDLHMDSFYHTIKSAVAAIA